MTDTRNSRVCGWIQETSGILVDNRADTLIVWTESNGVDMALSFQEADGCGAIW